MDTEDGKKPASGQGKISRIGRHTSASSSGLSRALRTTGVFFHKQLWIWPIAAAALLAVTMWSVGGLVRESAMSSLASKLETILRADVEALRIWLKGQEQYIEALASDDDIQGPVQALLEVASRDGSTAGDLFQSPALERLRDELTRRVISRGYTGFAVLAPDGRFLAARLDSVVGTREIELPQRLLEHTLGGRTVITRPYKSLVVLEAAKGPPRAGVPTMVAATPVATDEGEIIAVLGLRIRPEDDFTRILSIAQPGKSGETYAFDAAGVLISQSRYDDELKRIGLLLDDEQTPSILNVQIRDPGVDMTRGRRPGPRRLDQPLTFMASDAIGGDGKLHVKVDGYNDYRGVPVVGAWIWLKEYGFGVATEIDMKEAYGSLILVRNTHYALYGLLGASALAIFVFTVIVARLNQSARLAAIKAQKLGQYTLDEKLGAGAMGIVYRGHHSMLRRPTAIKLLPPERTTEAAIARFAREVQLTSQLNHPNTIAIYDYGRTPEGIFYYAMEYLDGIDLDSLVKGFGALPAGRVIRVVRQICGSLAEAHDVGLIHRDVKPANVVLNRRGGVGDVVKVLDFGLVKAVDAEEHSALTLAGSIIGTPLYMAPEGVQDSESVDTRSDLYSVGAVAYFLLTGKPLFEGKSIVEICNHQVNSAPVPPSERLGREVPRDLERIVLKCLEKDPADRFQSARELDAALSCAEGPAAWTDADANAWWDSYTPTRVSGPSSDRTGVSESETLIPPGSESGE